MTDGTVRKGMKGGECTKNGWDRPRQDGIRVKERQDTHSTTLGAMTLHGPHHVAKKSTTITPSSLRAASNEALLYSSNQLASSSLPLQSRFFPPSNSCTHLSIHSSTSPLTHMHIWCDMRNEQNKRVYQLWIRQK